MTFVFFLWHRTLEDRDLEKRIKVHMEKLKEHRGKTYGSIEEELESARKNLEMVSEALFFGTSGVSIKRETKQAQDKWIIKFLF